MDKIILTKRQAVALEKALENLFTKETVLKTHASIELKEKEKWKGSNYQYLNELTLEEMAIALYRGYEVEQTPEEKVLKKLNYVSSEEADFTTEYYSGFTDGIVSVLQAYGIQIKGINK